jgi:uncharacterized protein YgiM (DUF1202 family)
MMKTICTILGTLMAASLFAQDNTNLPAMPAPVSSPAAETVPAAAPSPTTSVNTPAATPSPAPVKHKRHHVMKSAAKKKSSRPEPAITLTPGPAVVSAGGLVVRGQAGLKGEEVTHLSKGDTVTVLEEINLAHHAADEPAQWAKIAYPTNGHVWVNAKYVDANGAVTTKKLNMRAGHGENFSVVGVIDQGTQVTKISTKGDWMEIQPPASAYAFVAAKYLNQEAGQQQMAMTSPTEVQENNPPTMQQAQPTPTSVPEQSPIVTTPQPAPEENTAPPAPSVRIVQHQGVIGGVGSMIAPTGYKLYDPDTKVDIDYLYVVPGSSFDLSKLVDAKVIVTGEEGIDQRWPQTPVIAIQSIQVIGTNVVKHLDTTIPRLRH